MLTELLFVDKYLQMFQSVTFDSYYEKLEFEPTPYCS